MTLAALLLLGTAAAAPVSAGTVIGFSDLGPACMPAIPSGYQGLTWQANIQTECNADYTSSYGNTYGSDTGYAATNGGAPGSGISFISKSSGTFDFISASFSTFAGSDAFQAYSALSLAIYGFAPGDLPDNPSFVALIDLDPTQYVTTILNFTGIDELMIASGSGPAFDPSTIFGTDGLAWLMTDMQIETAPEPGTMVLLCGGLIAFAAGRRTSTQYFRN